MRPPTGIGDARFRWPSSGAWWLALLAYVPALLAAPGRMPADSKLYLYLDPGGLMTDAASSFDPAQFGGWVPHQHISYLWPSGPWYWWFDAVGAPDWVAHRLWLGSLFLAAGLGVRWCARLLGVTPAAAVTAAMVYQISVYVLPYVSRTSVMLLAWAGLGWIVGATLRATRRPGWTDPAIIALVVATVGAVNATALAMIVPAPLLLLVHEARWGDTRWRDAATVGLRVAILSFAVSLWWIAALLIQGRYGADVLPYSESLADVSFTSTSAEVWRGLGYWLFYVRDPYAATTTESLRYLSSTPAIIVSYLVTVVCLVGVVWVRWVYRRYAALLIAVGGVLAVGVHPIADRSPLMRLVAGGDDGLALALRSSTRALPVLFLGLALAAGALVDSVPAGLPRTQRFAPVAVGVLVLLNLPGLWSGALVDPSLERDPEPPTAWLDAARSLDESANGRVLMLPGQEFGAYRWGYTVDQPLPGISNTPVVTRDLLPLGSPAAMDLLYAFDDRFQLGVAEPGALPSIARLFGADTVWLANDVAFERFRIPRPEDVRSVVLDAAGVDGTVRTFGPFAANIPTVPMLDEDALGDPRVGEPMPTVELVTLDVDAPIARVYDAAVLVAGSGDGLVDAAAAGLLVDAAVVRYVAHTAGIDGTTVAQIVTDSNRDRARHWRSSQDTTGYTEPGGPGNALLADAVGDARLPVFDDGGPGTETVAVQVGSVTATASSYGEPFALLPEHRPAMAIDGDPATAWIVGEHGNPVGETLQLRFDNPFVGDTLSIHQTSAPGARRITHVRVAAWHSEIAAPIERTIALDGRSVTPTGQPVELDGLDGARWLDLTITAVGGGEPGTAGAVAGVGFAEIGTALGPTTELVRPPAAAPDPAAAVPLAHLFTRERVDPMDRWRSDPEPVLARQWELETARTVEPTYTVRVDRRSADRTLAELFGWPVVADDSLDGSLRHTGAAAFDGDPATAWITPFDQPYGTITISTVERPIDEITVVQSRSDLTRVLRLDARVGDEIRSVTLEGDRGRIEPPLPPGELVLTITEITPATTTDRRFGDLVVLPVAISEISFDGAPRLPVVGTDSLTMTCAEIGRLDDSALRATLTLSGQDWVDGAPVDVSPCDGPVALDAGPHMLIGSNGPFELDRVLLDAGAVDALRATDRTSQLAESRRDRFGGAFTVTGCTSGCWFVFGEGHSDGWSATADGRVLGPPVVLDGGFTGWWLPPGTTSVSVNWDAQTIQTLAILISLSVCIGLLALLLVARRSGTARPAPHESPGRAVVATPTWSWERRPSAIPSWAIVVVWAMSALLVAGPVWALLGGVAGAVTAARRTVPIAGLVAVASVIVIGAVVAAVELRDAPYPGGGWPAAFEPLHWVGMFAFAALIASATTDGE